MAVKKTVVKKPVVKKEVKIKQEKPQQAEKTTAKNVQNLELRSKQFSGTVVSDKMTNTVVIEIMRKVRHPVYKKIVKISRKLKADTNGMDVKTGNLVVIEQTRPISKDKNFKVVKVVS